MHAPTLKSCPYLLGCPVSPSLSRKLVIKWALNTLCPEPAHTVKFLELFLKMLMKPVDLEKNIKCKIWQKKRDIGDN